MKFADISFNLPMNKSFTYGIPEEFEDLLTEGQRVTVSFLKDSSKTGLIRSIHDKKPSFNIKNILKIYPEDFFRLPSYAPMIADFISRYYGSSLNEALHLFVPDGFLKADPNKQEPLNLPIIKKDFFNTLNLSTEQEDVYKSIIKKSSEGGGFSASLIFGITGSGKTEVYQKLLSDCIKKGQQGLLLLPEIGITEQTLTRFSAYFDSKYIAFIHSRLTKKQKLTMFKKISTGEVCLIIGPRSALFSPFKSLGMVILDEEHDFSYKSHKSPRYHTRHVAYFLAQKLGIPFIMGSATPSLETFHAAKNNKIDLYYLKKRFFKTPLPPIEVVNPFIENSFFSKELIQKMVKAKQDDKQSILFMNRRGFAPTVICKECSFIVVCPDCSISLTYHKGKKELLCHYCGYRTPFSPLCPTCEKNTLMPKGLGTEGVEQEIQDLFHSFKILRMDRDTTQKKGAHDDIITQFRKKKADVLIGTQMITKGLDFPSVSVVGILSCDSLLNLPDFRSFEYTFSLITQVAGRAGRKEAGEVVLQTQYHNTPVIQHALKHDYEGFYAYEIIKRKDYNYPPFVKILRFIVRSPEEAKAKKIIDKLKKSLQESFPEWDVLGPSPCVLEKIAAYYRYHLIVKVKNPAMYGQKIYTLLKEFNNIGNYHVEYDVDPTTLL